MTEIRKLNFQPFFGLRSKHLQMIISTFTPTGKAPYSKQWLVDMGDGDKLSCEISTPNDWKNNHKTIVMIHGLGGSHNSRYMIRIARKLYDKGNKIVRVNLRGCGSGYGLSKLPYCAGNSNDVIKVLEELKKESPDSEIFLIGFSLGGNIALKLASELGVDAPNLVKKVFAISPPFDLEQTVLLIQQKKHFLYHQYYLKNILKNASSFSLKKIHSIYEFDDIITGPSWGFSGAKDYYQHCSCKYFLHNIHVTCHILCAEDDPFVSLDDLKGITFSDHVHLWTTKYGSHMGFLGRTKTFQWLDHLLSNWIHLE